MNVSNTNPVVESFSMLYRNSFQLEDRVLIVCLFLELCWYDLDKKMAQPPRSVGRRSTPCISIIHLLLAVVNNVFGINNNLQPTYSF